MQDSVLSRLRARCGAAWVAHRLDLDTSGLLVGAKSEAAYVELQRQFSAREVEKRYVAIVEKEMAFDERMIELVDMAEQYLVRQRAWDVFTGKPAAARVDVASQAALRRAISDRAGAPMIVRTCSR